MLYFVQAENGLFFVKIRSREEVRMSSRKKMIADLLFGVQIVCTLIFGGAQFVRMLTTSKGVSISWFVLWEAFLILNLILAAKAHKNQPSRVTLQTLISYRLWVVMVAADLGVMIFKGRGTWDRNDTITTAIALLGILLTFAVGRAHGHGFADPIIKGWLAVFFKGIPQLTLAYKIFLVGGAGLAGLTMVMGHITVLTRLGQLVFSICEAGWDRNRRGSALSEIANETSWTVTTIAWLYHH